MGNFWGVNLAERWRTPASTKVAAYRRCQSAQTRFRILCRTAIAPHLSFGAEAEAVEQTAASQTALQRTEEAIVVTTGAPREPGCPTWVVLGVKAVEARGVRAA